MDFLGSLFTALLMKVRATPPAERGTGQIFFRKSGTAPDGRQLYMVVGVMAMPADCPWKGEHQVPAFVAEEGRVMGLGIGEEIDRTEIAKGLNAGDLLTQHIWIS